MKPSIAHLNEKSGQEAIEQKILSLHRVRDIMEEEGIQYTDEELQEVIEFISKWIIISTDHYNI